MSKITIIEGNSNDKDNMRAFMVKGEPGDSPTASVTKEGNTATITITDYNGTTTTTLTDGVDGVSPTASVSKTGKVSTLTVTDGSGTTTATINDGEDGEVNVIDTFNTQEDKHTNAPSINAVENYVNDKLTFSTTENIIGTYENGKPIYRRKIVLNNFAVADGTVVAFADLGLSLNIEKIVRFWGKMHEVFSGSLASTKMYPLYNLAGTKVIFLIVDENGFGFHGSDTWSAQTTRTHEIYIEYTKTTDVV